MGRDWAERPAVGRPLGPCQPAWIAPFLATAVAFAVMYYGAQLLHRGDVRRAILVFFILAFAAAGVAGLFGAFITKAAPVA